MITEQYVDYLAHVLSCAAKGATPDDLPDGIDIKEFIQFCDFHKVINIVYLTIGDKLPNDIQITLRHAFDQSLLIHATQQYYLEKIEAEFETIGIDYLILKGRELACLYPSEDMRQSSDIDIYIGKEKASQARDIMLNIGFKIEAYSDFNDDHDEYSIDRLVLCELHRVLIQDEHPWQSECNKIPERLVLKKGTKHCYEMTAEDFYVYNLAHTAKHMKLSGIGIRVFLDQWLIYKKYRDVFDYSKLQKTLRLAKLDKFNKNAVELYEYWFDGKMPLNPSIIKQMAIYVAQSGWIGTSEQFTATELAENAGSSGSKRYAKIKLCFKIIFSPYESMVERYPFLARQKWLTPFCRIHRIFSAAVHKRDLVKQVTGGYDNADIDYGKELVTFKRNIGL